MFYPVRAARCERSLERARVERGVDICVGSRACVMLTRARVNRERGARCVSPVLRARLRARTQVRGASAACRTKRLATLSHRSLVIRCQPPPRRPLDADYQQQAMSPVVFFTRFRAPCQRACRGFFFFHYVRRRCLSLPFIRRHRHDAADAEPSTITPDSSSVFDYRDEPAELFDDATLRSMYFHPPIIA